MLTWHALAPTPLLDDDGCVQYQHLAARCLDAVMGVRRQALLGVHACMQSQQDQPHVLRCATWR